MLVPKFLSPWYLTALSLLLIVFALFCNSWHLCSFRKGLCSLSLSVSISLSQFPLSLSVHKLPIHKGRAQLRSSNLLHPAEDVLFFQLKENIPLPLMITFRKKCFCIKYIFEKFPPYITESLFFVGFFFFLSFFFWYLMCVLINLFVFTLNTGSFFQVFARTPLPWRPSFYCFILTFGFQHHKVVCFTDISWGSIPGHNNNPKISLGSAEKHSLTWK